MATELDFHTKNIYDCFGLTFIAHASFCDKLCLFLKKEKDGKGYDGNNW